MAKEQPRMISFDTNLLVYAHRKESTKSLLARKAIKRGIELGKGWGIPLTCVTEFWNIVTHANFPPKPSPPIKAMTFIQSLLESGKGEIWNSGEGFGLRMLQLASDLKIHGTRIFDLQTSLIAFENGATEIWTNDRHFLAIPGLKVYHPFNDT